MTTTIDGDDVIEKKNLNDKQKNEKKTSQEN